MKQIDLNKQLLKMIPDLQKNFDDVCDELDGIETGSTIVIEDVFMPFFIDSIKCQNNKHILQSKSFIEWLSGYYDDEYAGDILVISVYENIHSLNDEKIIVNLLGPQARKQYDAIKWK